MSTNRSLFLVSVCLATGALAATSPARADQVTVAATGLIDSAAHPDLYGSFGTELALTITYNTAAAAEPGSDATVASYPAQFESGAFGNDALEGTVESELASVANDWILPSHPWLGQIDGFFLQAYVTGLEIAYTLPGGTIHTFNRASVSIALYDYEGDVFHDTSLPGTLALASFHPGPDDILAPRITFIMLPPPDGISNPRFDASIGSFTVTVVEAPTLEELITDLSSESPSIGDVQLSTEPVDGDMTGPNATANAGRLNSIVNRLIDAVDLFASDLLLDGCEVLDNVIKKTQGNNAWFAGDAAAALAAAAAELKAENGCP